VKVPMMKRVANSHYPRVMRGVPRGTRRSVDRGADRPAIEPRKTNLVQSADAFVTAEGNTGGNVNASSLLALRGPRPWHVRKLFVREPGGLLFDRGRQSRPTARIGKARSRSR
jgi:hypothetical protein